MGMIEHVWHPNKLSLSKRASTHRIVYDKGWHGGNRAKSPSPDGDDGSWGACGLCGEPDSQDHWIRLCQFEEVCSIRRDARISARELVDNITSTKGNHQNRRDCFNIYSEVLTWAVEGAGGEQLWVESYLNLWWMNSSSVSIELSWILPLESLRLTSGRDPSKLSSPFWQRQLKPCGWSKKPIAVQMPRDSLFPYPSPSTASVVTRLTFGDTANGKR